MKIAVIKTGGKQYVVKEKDKIKIEKLANKDKVDFETLLVADDDNVEIGAPTLKQKVEAKIIKDGRTRKVTGVKYKPKTRQAKKFGHRQHFTEVEISKI